MSKSGGVFSAKALAAATGLYSVAEAPGALCEPVVGKPGAQALDVDVALVNDVLVISPPDWRSKPRGKTHPALGERVQELELARGEVRLAPPLRTSTSWGR